MPFPLINDFASRRSAPPRRLLWWGLATAYIVVTYATLSDMPGYWRAIDGLLAGRGILFQYLLYATVGAVVLGLLYRRGFLRSLRNLAATGLVVVLFAAMFALQKNPGEKIHMFQYGVFGWLLYKALRLHFPAASARLYLCGSLLCLLAGALDEVIQGMLPNRYFTLHDVVINGLSGVVVLGYLYYYQRNRLE